jgi:hypothetical protein
VTIGRNTWHAQFSTLRLSFRLPLDARHDPLESAWLSSRIPSEAVEPVIEPKVEDQEDKKLGVQALVSSSAKRGSAIGQTRTMHERTAQSK